MSAIEPGSGGEPRVPVSPQLAWRVALIGGLAMVMFGVIFFRLWFLQILSGPQYVQQAEANRTRELPIPAPRGEIVDRNGQPIASTTVTNAVQIVPDALPPAGHARLALYRRLGRLLHMSPAHIQALVIHGRSEVPYAPVTIQTDAGLGVLTVLGERATEFPGVVQQPVSLRTYPHGEMAAQALGFVGQVTEEELKRKAFKGVPLGSVVGQQGLEYYYDRYLRGVPGKERVQVEAQGYPVPTKLPATPPQPGHVLQLTLDLQLEKAAEAALREGIERARAGGKPAVAGGFIAMDPRNGEILALGSYPSFDPNKLAKPIITPAELKELEGEGHPLVDRVTEATYPTGSTFKPITAMAALEAGILNPEEGLGGGQCIEFSGKKFCNAGETNYGNVGLVNALKVSSDTYFFEVGERSFFHGEIIQKMAHELGIADESGLELPEAPGLVPGPKWRDEVNHEEEACKRRRHLPTCGYVLEVRPWEPGDNMDLAVGQGELQTDPLQLAVAYSTLANAYMNAGNGAVVTPHLGKQIDTQEGAILQTLSFPPRRHVHLNDGNLGLVMQGIHEAASENGGTSADVWAGWDQEQDPVYGKTGTAERFANGAKVENQSWYMCFLDNPQRPIVIAVTVEQGGYGAETAAPIARLIASQWYGKPKKFVVGTSKTL